MKREIIKTKRTIYCFLGRLNGAMVAEDRLNVSSDWEGCSSITAARLPEFPRMDSRRLSVIRIDLTNSETGAPLTSEDHDDYSEEK
jgi:hypothetical protein